MTFAYVGLCGFLRELWAVLIIRSEAVLFYLAACFCLWCCGAGADSAKHSEYGHEYYHSAVIWQAADGNYVIGCIAGFSIIGSIF